MNTSLIFQRTHTGRAEIQEKRHGLTQSERLVLIMIDGITSYGDVRKKLPVLRDERFVRAFNTLIAKELIVEVFLPVPDQTAETVERTVIDRFLQQDPLDPVTVIIYDVEEELGEATPLRRATNATEPVTILPATPETSIRTTISGGESEALAAQVAQTAMDDHHNALADALASEVKKRREPTWHQASMAIHGHAEPPGIPLRKHEGVKSSANWPYWSIGIGIAFITGFAAARLPL